MDESPGASPTATRLRQRLSRCGGWLLSLSGLFAISGGNCPCCGQPACPVGTVGVGLLGATLAIGTQIWKRITKS